jgi:hypothetical protein
MGVFSSFSRHKLLKDKFTWRSQMSIILFLDYKHPKSEPKSPVAPTWRTVIDVTSNRARQLQWMCGLCMKQRHSVTHAVQRGKTETNGLKFLFLASIYRYVCGNILCIVHKWNLLVWSYEWWNILVRCREEKGTTHRIQHESIHPIPSGQHNHGGTTIQSITSSHNLATRLKGILLSSWAICSLKK